MNHLTPSTSISLTDPFGLCACDSSSMGSRLGNAFRNIPLIGGILGGAADIASGVVSTALSAITLGRSGTLGGGVRQIGNGLEGAVNGSLNLVGKAWNAPNSAIGLTAGLVGWALGGEAPRVDHNAIVFGNSSIASTGAITLGNAIIFGTPFGPTGPNSGPNFPMDNGPIGLHEEQHTYQGQVLGPLYIPSNALGLGAGVLFNHGNEHGPANWNEIGPQSIPPSPWPWH